MQPKVCIVHAERVQYQKSGSGNHRSGKRSEVISFTSLFPHPRTILVPLSLLVRLFFAVINQSATRIPKKEGHDTEQYRRKKKQQQLFTREVDDDMILFFSLDALFLSFSLPLSVDVVLFLCLLSQAERKDCCFLKQFISSRDESRKSKMLASERERKLHFLCPLS